MRALRIGLLGYFLPGLRHFLQEFAVLLALSLASQAAAFLRKPQELRCLFHVRKNRAVAAPFPNAYPAMPMEPSPVVLPKGEVHGR